MEEAKHGLAEREEQKSERMWSPVAFLLMVLAAVAMALCVVQLIWF
jgi:hypothetical protein